MDPIFKKKELQEERSKINGRSRKWEKMLPKLPQMVEHQDSLRKFLSNKIIEISKITRPQGRA
jgi:hypothetical protein